MMQYQYEYKYTGKYLLSTWMHLDDSEKDLFKTYYMEFKIYTKDKGEFEYLPELLDPIKKDFLTGADAFCINGEFGQMEFHEIKMTSFSIWNSSYKMNEEITLYGAADMPVLELQFVFKNTLDYKLETLGEMQILPRQFNITYTPFIVNKTKLIIDQPYETFDVHFSAVYLEEVAANFPILSRFLEYVTADKSSTLSKTNHFVSPAMLVVIEQIKYCPFHGVMRTLYLENKVYELLLLVLEKASNSSSSSFKIQPYDIDKLYEAREIVVSNLSEPLSILKLAKKVGINDFKLKKAFKQLFGTTVFGYVHQIRMEQAKQMLQDTNLSVTEIALTVGYHTVSNFSTAFKNYFGYSPGIHRKE